MKPSPTLRFVTRASILVGALALAACSQPKDPNAPTISTPFAEGRVDASYEARGDGEVEVRVKHLGSERSVESTATTYVVWLTPDGSNVPQNAGALRVDSMAEETFEFTTPFKRFTLAITPEPAADAVAMTGAAVLQADIIAN